MKKFLSVFVAIIICSSYTFAQSANDLVFSFVKTEKEKILQKNDDGSRYSNFVISGIKSDEQANNLAAAFKKSDYVIDFTISDESAPNQRNGHIVIKKDTKFEHLRDMLKANGIAFVKVNETLTAVSDLKSRAEKKRMAGSNAAGGSQETH
jgi:hypothetical protein